MKKPFRSERAKNQTIGWPKQSSKKSRSNEVTPKLECGRRDRRRKLRTVSAAAGNCLVRKKEREIVIVFEKVNELCTTYHRLQIMDVRKVAKLAHLEITDEEVALYTPQMDEIVEYVEQLNELDTEDIEPMLGGLTPEGEATETIREDVSGVARAESRARSGAVGASRDISRCRKFCMSASKFRVRVHVSSVNAQVLLIICAYCCCLFCLLSRAAFRISKSPNAPRRGRGQSSFIRFISATI